MSRKFGDFPSASDIALDALFLIFNEQLNRNEKVTLSQLGDNIPYVRTNQFSDLLNETVSFATVQEALDAILFPYQAPAVSNLSIDVPSTSLEVGASIAAGSYTVTFSITNPDNVDGTLTLSNSDTGTISTNISPVGSGSSVTLSEITKTSNTSSVFTLSGTDTQGTAFSTTFTVNWTYIRMYFTYGSGDSPPAFGEVLVGTRPLGDTRTILNPANIGTELDSIVDIGTNADLLESSGRGLQTYAAPESGLGENSDFRVYFVYADVAKSSLVIESSLGAVSTVSQSFTWTRNGVLSNYTIYSIDQDYVGAESPELRVS